MNLHQLLLERQARDEPLRVAVIGAGKFASMFLAQAPGTPGMHVLAVCDLDVTRARQNLAAVGWPAPRFAAASLDEARRAGTTFVGDDAMGIIESGHAQVVVDSTGDPVVGVRHALASAEHGAHVVMVNVEADVLAGPLLARRARDAGVVYSLAYGDQPALIAEQVDWARACGFQVVCAGKGTKYLPEFHASTPDTVWDYYGITPEKARAGGMNPKMFNSFLDGTKSGIEMAAVANATGLRPPSGGLAFPPCGTHELAEKLRPESDGGLLEGKGMVEVISSLQRDGSDVERDLRWGVYVVFEAPNDYTARCFSEYGVPTDSSGRYASLYRPSHLIGLELGVSIASAVLRGEPTGAPEAFRADVIATAKRELRAGERLDGEGGHTVWGRLMPAPDSVELGALPIGLANDVTLKRDVATGQCVRWSDVDVDESSQVVKIRREMEQSLATSRAA
jgi:predicted homoserine dehydrogenase-like protein